MEGRDLGLVHRTSANQFRGLARSRQLHPSHHTVRRVEPLSGQNINLIDWDVRLSGRSHKGHMAGHQLLSTAG